LGFKIASKIIQYSFFNIQWNANSNLKIPSCYNLVNRD